MSTTAIDKTGQDKDRPSSRNISAPPMFTLTLPLSSSSFRKVELTQCRLDTAQRLYGPVAIISIICFNIHTPWYLPIQRIYVFHILRTTNGLFPSDRMWSPRSLLWNGHWGFPEIKLPLSSSTEVKNEWRYSLSPPYAFMVWTGTTSPSQLPTSLSLQCRGPIYCLFNDTVSISDYSGEW